MRPVHVDTNFGGASIAVHTSGSDVLVTIGFGRLPAQRVTLTAVNATELAEQLAAAGRQAQVTAEKVARTG